MEELVSDMFISDMKEKLDPAQFGNHKHVSVQHYLIRLLHRILTSVDNNSSGEIKAALLLFIDFKQAYSWQCHTLSVQSFIKNGVRPALTPLLISYFENREMRVKWHNKLSTTRTLPGSGAMGSTIGIWEFLSQTNNNSDFIPVEDKYKFVDDLTALEIINMISIGLSSYNFKQQVPSDVPSHGQVIPNSHLLSQQYLQKIDKWATNNKMMVSKHIY